MRGGRGGKRGEVREGKRGEGRDAVNTFDSTCIYTYIAGSN